MAKDLHIPYLFPISSTSLTGNFENTENTDEEEISWFIKY